MRACTCAFSWSNGTAWPADLDAGIEPSRIPRSPAHRWRAAPNSGNSASRPRPRRRQPQRTAAPHLPRITAITWIVDMLPSLRRRIPRSAWAPRRMRQSRASVPPPRSLTKKSRKIGSRSTWSAQRIRCRDVSTLQVTWSVRIGLWVRSRGNPARVEQIRDRPHVPDRLRPATCDRRYNPSRGRSGTPPASRSAPHTRSSSRHRRAQLPRDPLARHQHQRHAAIEHHRCRRHVLPQVELARVRPMQRVPA